MRSYRWNIFLHIGPAETALQAEGNGPMITSLHIEQTVLPGSSLCNAPDFAGRMSAVWTTVSAAALLSVMP